MGYDVTKMPIPEALGAGPVYDPEANKKFEKKSFGSGRSGSGKGKPHFKNRKK
jgi:hypothetical protein